MLWGTIATAAVAATFAAPAFAGSVAYTGYDGTAQTFTFTAAAGETNDVVVTNIPNAADPTHATCTGFSPCVRISDPIGVTETGGSCHSASATAVDCPRTGATRVIVQLGDGDDAVATNGLLDDRLTVDGGPGTDTITGGNGADGLSGGSGADTLQGESGNDTLDGGAGPDDYFGGGDDDLLKNSYHNDSFIGNGGFDTVDYTGWNSFDTSCFPDPCPIGVDVTIDNDPNDGDWDLDSADAQGGDFTMDNVRGDVEAMIGTAVGDTLNGGPNAIDQTFTGAGGDDTIVGGPGIDRVRESAVTESANVTMTLGNGTLTGWFGTDAFGGIENVDLHGGNGNDALDASAYTAGPVGIDGGNGDDTLTGGAGDDTLDGSAGSDRLVESPDANMTLTDGGLAGPATGNDSLANVEQVTLNGGAGNNVLNASAYTNGPVTLDGRAGIDTLQGGSQADTLTGGPGNDTIDGGGSTGDRILETADANMTLTNGGLAGPATGNDSLANAELATLNGGPGANVLNASGFSGAVTINGGEGPDTLSGGSAADTLSGEDGDDTVSGGQGDDTLNGNPGADALNGGAGLDALNGGDGDDVLDGGTDGVNDVLHGDAGTNRVVGSGDTNWTLQNTSLIGNGNDALFEIQRATLTGGPGDNALNASAFTLGPVALDGGAGADFLLGGSGKDTLVGGQDPDTFDGGDGDDDLRARDSASDASLVCGAGAADVANVDTGENADASCETVWPPPAATIQTGPTGLVNSRDATFTFDGSGNAARFLCALDGGAPTECASAKTYAGLADGSHTFSVRAEDSGGDAGPAVTRTWTVDATAPNTIIDSGPSATTNDPTPTFTFHFTEAGSTLQCKVDAGAFAACASPRTLGHLADRSHTFQVRAKDPAGNLDSSPASRSFTVKTAEVKRSGSTLLVTAAPGAKDNLKVTKPSPSTIRVTDLPSGSFTGSGVHVGSGCARSGDYTANCSAASISMVKVSSGTAADRVLNMAPLPITIDGGAGNDALIGGVAADRITGGTGADAMKGMNGNDTLLARDLASDTAINCDGGPAPGTADKADLDKLLKDSSVSGCEAQTRH